MRNPLNLKDYVVMIDYRDRDEGWWLAATTDLKEKAFEIKKEQDIKHKNGGDNVVVFKVIKENA